MTETTPPRYEAQFKADRVLVRNNFINPDGSIFITTALNLSVEEATELVASLRTALAIGRNINSDTA